MSLQDASEPSGRQVVAQSSGQIISALQGRAGHYVADDCRETVYLQLSL
jgi:hypothetical protein